MQTYQINAWVSENGIISLPNMPDLYNKKVQLVITLKESEPKKSATTKTKTLELAAKKTETEEAKKDKSQLVSDFAALCHSAKVEAEADAANFPKKRLATDFLRKWSGIIKDKPDLPDEEESLVDKLRYKYLKKKYDIDGSYISDEDVDDARYDYLMEKYK
ncbi:MAG: hypothetical protein LBL94_01235 [Prevotellaceae bacterium]|jgi:hypothetical protein|nr:hypothetical protein [Prevotellaceae bacterium]